MKQSTFSAVMANSIKNLLQGYTKGIRFLLVMFLTLCSSTMWGAKDDIVYKYGGTKLGISNSYDSYSNSNISSSIFGSTISTASWACTCGSNQSSGLWLGSNNNQKAKMILSTGNLSETSAIASAINVSTSDTYYSALICRTNFSNVYKVNLTYTTPGGTAPSEAWILYSIDNGSTWSVGKKVTSLSSLDTEFDLGSTIPNARYAFVIHCTGYCQFKVPILTFYEGETTPSCTAPASVTVTPTNENGWRYSIGETISLEATAEGGSGDYTYQWQKYIETAWEDIDGATSQVYTKENCGTGDGGSYRCKVSTGDGCDTYSEGYFIRVFTLFGGYYGESMTDNKIVWSSANEGVATIHLNASSTYLFKVTDNDGKWFGYGDASNYIVQPWSADCGTETGNGINADIRLFTGPEGDYTFTINIEHSQETSPYVNIAVAYPNVEHPVEGYGYITKWWNECYIHWWDNNNDALTAWGSDARINTYTTICETEYYFFPIIDNYINLIIKDKAGNPSNTTGDQTQTGHSGWYITHDGNSWGWHEFATYTITFDANGGTGSMNPINGICPGDNQTLPANTFTRTGYTFDGWATSANGNKAYNDKATISNINSNITLYARWKANTYTITSNLTNCSSSPAIPTSYTYTGSAANLSYTITAASGYRLPDAVTVSGTTYTWDKNTGLLKLTGTINSNVTITITAIKVHTITWMVGSNSVQTEEVANATGVTQTPGDDIADDAIGDCANAFMGWSEKSAGSTPQDEDYYDDLCTAAQMKSKHSSVTSDKTFYAVFATAEGVSSTDYTKITSDDDLTSGDYVIAYSYNGGTQIVLKNEEKDSKQMKADALSPSNNVYANPNSAYIWHLEKQSDGTYTCYNSAAEKNLYATTSELQLLGTATKYKIAYDATNSRWTIKLNSSTNYYVHGYVSGSTYDFRVSTSGADEKYRVYLYKNTSTVNYSNYVTNCCALAPATNLTVSGTTAISATLTWTAPSPTTGITKLQVRDENGNVKVDNLAANATTATITGLTECTSYKYYVVSVGECEVVSNTVTATPFSGAKTVNYDYNGGSGSPESFTTSCDHQKIYLPTPTRPGYTFDGWYDLDGNFVGVGGAEYNPATSPITLYAHWTETIYQLTHNGSNYTNTENKTSIKSSETPFTLHYTCTGDYGLPATISITGGGKSWTVGTDYTWEVAADRQSATLVIKETVISADVTITINVATRYTVTFVHNDKGVFSGSETIEVLSSENTITLPTVTDVSCGFYDTFEGWIVSNDEYVESTTKPATVYAGGASYKVTGDCTFRALYSKCEGDATQVYRKVTTIDEVTNGIYILVSNNLTPYVYSGHGDGNDYANIISGLTADGDDYSTLLPSGAVQLTVTRGTGDNASRFTIQNGTKYFKAGSDIALQDAVSWWQLTTGEQVNSKNCPAGALQPVNATDYVMQQYQSNRFKTYKNTQSYYVFLYKLIDKCTKYYSTNPSCEKPVGVHIVYNANAVDASMSCSTQDRTYKVENDVNKYPQLASQLQFYTNATREGYTLVGWNTQSNGQGTTYNINQNYYNLPVSGELDGDKWITLNLYAMWKPCIKFNLGNATGGTGVPDAVVENGECVLPTPTAEQLGTIPCGYEFYAWSETSVLPTQTKPVLFMPGDTYTGSALTLYAVYRWCEGNTGSDTYYFTFIVDDKTYCITQKHNNYDRFVVAEATSGLIFGLENGYLYYLDEGVKTFVYWEGNSTTVTTTITYPNAATQKTTFVEGDNGTTIVTPAISGRYLQMPSSYTDRAYYTTDGINPTLVEVQTTTCTYATNPTCYTNTNLHFVTNGGTLNYPTNYDETDYQELAPGSTVFLPTATFAGEWTFEGWKRGAPLESTTTKPYDPSFYPVTLNSTQFEVDDLGDIYFYAVYSKTNDDKQFDPVNGGTYKLFAIGADGTKTYMPIWSGGRGTLSGVTTCAETGDYTITPGTGTHAGQYQITCGEYTLGVVGDISQTDLNEVEGTWWNINQSTSGKGTWRITVVGSSERALSCLFSTAKSFGNYAISNLNNPSQTIYRDMEIGECIYTEYTSTPENIPYITITGAPVKITSTNGERVYASTTVHIEAHNFTGERIIHLSATNGFGVDPVQVRTNGQGAYSGNVKVYYEPTTDGDGQTINSSVLTASQTGGTNAEKISQTFAAIQGRNMPANFVIAAKWDGHWYALPANCTSSLSSTEGLLIEVNDVENPTMATSAPASAKYGLREVIPSRQTDYGQGIVFTERFAEGDKQFALYNGSNANIQVNAQYTNYAQTNPDKYEWIPSTSDFNDYTLTNASTGRNLGLTSGTFGAYTAASNQVRLLPATFYEPAPVQVLKWKKNSVIVMYTGAEATATTQVGNNAQSAEQTLAGQKLTHGIYELTSDQALTTNAGGTLSLTLVQILE